MAAAMPADEYDVIIVGAGVSGIAAGHYLRQAAEAAGTPLRWAVLERGGAVGGTWYANSYPGAACDIMSHWYSYSFNLNPWWTRRYARQPEIRAYLEATAAKVGVAERVQLNSAVEGAVWEEAAARWVLSVRDTRSGAQRTLTARFVLAGVGALSTTCTPDLPGAASFKGPAFHTGQWDHSVDYRGKTVAVIGTGCSAAQVVPAIVGTAGKVVVFQRSAAWISTRGDYAYSTLMRWAFALIPGLLWLYRMTLASLHDVRYRFFVRPAHPAMFKLATWMANRLRAKQVPDPLLREALTPHYPMGCKRVIVTDDFLPCFMRPDVQLVTGPILRLEDGAIVTGPEKEPARRADPAAKEVRHPIDVLVYATGFDVVASVDSLGVTGRGGLTMHKAFQAAGGPEAYLGVVAPHFPNMGFLMGPNSGLGHSSMIAMIEAQARYLAHLVTGCLASGHAAFEVKQDVHAAYNAQLQAELAKNVWAGCASWYNLGGQKNVSLWPHTVYAYHKALWAVDWAAFRRTPLQQAAMGGK